MPRFDRNGPARPGRGSKAPSGEKEPADPGPIGWGLGLAWRRGWSACRGTGHGWGRGVAWGGGFGMSRDDRREGERE